MNGWKLIGDVIVGVPTSERIEPEEFSRACELIENGRVRMVVGVVLWTKSLPPIDQRSRMMSAIARGGVSTMIVTDSKFATALVTLAAWSGVKVRSFPLVRLAEAVEATGLGQDGRAEFMRFVNAHRAGHIGRDAS